jgi:hypothetical protein
VFGVIVGEVVDVIAVAWDRVGSGVDIGVSVIEFGVVVEVAVGVASGVRVCSAG